MKGAPATVDRDMKRNVWYKINGARINRPTRQGEHVYFEFSPYDVPEAVSGELDEQQGTAKVFFKYINDEPVSRIDMNDFVVYVGKLSHRLHKMEMQAKTVHQKGIVSAVTQALERLRKDRPTQAPPDRYDIAKGIVSDVGDKLLERVA
jgi:hypothetical protein